MARSDHVRYDTRGHVLKGQAGKGHGRMGPTPCSMSDVRHGLLACMGHAADARWMYMF